MKFASRFYLNSKVDLHRIGNFVLGFFKEEGFVTQRTETKSGIIIQAKKGGILRALLSTNKAITAVIMGNNNSMDIKLGVRQWMENDDQKELNELSFNAISFFDEIPESLWAYELEHHLWNHLETNIEID